MTRCLHLTLAALLLGAPAAFAQKGVPPSTVMVGGHPMTSDQDIMDNLAQSAEHTIFVSLIQAAGLADALRAHGPFTVFAPTNAAFAALPAGMMDSLRRPENKNSLIALLSMNILPGNFSSARMHYLLRSSKGSVDIGTVGGPNVTVSTNGPLNLTVQDAHGDLADIILYDVKQANGVVYVTDNVLQPG